MALEGVALVVTAFGALVGGTGGLSALVGVLRQGKTNQQITANQVRLQKDQSIIKDQVKNDHPSNLRDDIDGLHEKIGELADSTREGFGDIRSELRADREKNRADEENHRSVHKALWHKIMEECGE